MSGLSNFGFLGFLAIAFGLLLYFLPTLNALGKHRPNSTTIFLLNLFLGWTVIAWILIFTWSGGRQEKAAVTDEEIADRDVDRWSSQRHG